MYPLIDSLHNYAGYSLDYFSKLRRILLSSRQEVGAQRKPRAKADHFRPKQSLPGLITGSVIGALFLVIVIGIVVVMHIREHKKRTLAWKAEKRDRAEAVSHAFS